MPPPAGPMDGAHFHSADAATPANDGSGHRSPARAEQRPFSVRSGTITASVTLREPPRPFKGERTSGPGDQSEPHRRVPSRVRRSRGAAPCCDDGVFLFPGPGRLAQGWISLRQTRAFFLCPSTSNFGKTGSGRAAWRASSITRAELSRLLIEKTGSINLKTRIRPRAPGKPAFWRPEPRRRLKGHPVDGQQKSNPSRSAAKRWRSWRPVIRKVAILEVDATR